MWKIYGFGPTQGDHGVAIKTTNSGATSQVVASSKETLCWMPGRGSGGLVFSGVIGHMSMKACVKKDLKIHFHCRRPLQK